jgi:hypothetical protein
MSSVEARVQAMPPFDQALVLCDLAASRTGDSRFAPADALSLYVEIGLPSPRHIGNVLASLERRGDVTRPPNARGRWRLTPFGRERVRDLITTDDMLTLARAAGQAAGSNLAGTTHPVLPPWLAPPAIEPSVASFLEQHPFSRNVFAMTRFPEEEDDQVPDPVGNALTAAGDACAAHGMELHLASREKIVDDLWGNVAAHMWASQFGISFFENRVGRGLNYNLTVEVGAMLLAGRRCALLKDVSSPSLPTDLVGHIYTTVDFEDTVAIQLAVHSWLANDLRLGACPTCPAD